MISLQINKLQRDEKKSGIYSYDQKFVREALKKKKQKIMNLELFPFAPPPKKNSEKGNSENWSQSRYPPSLKKS